MQPIHKNTPLIDLDEWVEHNLTPNNALLALRNCNSEKKAAFWWKKLSNTGVWGKLKNHLLQEQGFVCCYCGGRIGEHTMEIEHFYPKSNGVYVGLMFTYENLFASCSTPKIHVVKRSETVGDILKYYGIGIQNMALWIEKEPIRSDDIVEIGDISNKKK
ncbi:MAG: hypothetical protein ACOVQA_10570 [Thermoflexibacteraceae bacterium]|jgi:uncharacterized protein (TIGR02646 family)